MEEAGWQGRKGCHRVLREEKGSKDSETRALWLKNSVQMCIFIIERTSSKEQGQKKEKFDLKYTLQVSPGFLAFSD